LAYFTFTTRWNKNALLRLASKQPKEKKHFSNFWQDKLKMITLRLLVLLDLQLATKSEHDIYDKLVTL